MTIDRYTKIVLTVIAVALAVIAARPFFSEPSWSEALRLTSAHAQTPPGVREATIPKAWGKYINYQSGNLLLEGADRSLRIVDLDGKPPEYPKMKWVIKFE